MATTFDLNKLLGSGDEDAHTLFPHDPARERSIREASPWKNDPLHFRRVRVSSLALLKMAIHTREGGDLEVMGIMVGKVRGDTIVVMDVIALPVEGTETRVNAMAQANEYLIQYLEAWKDAGRGEGAVGWYHSHPGYGCWLSGIDVETQALNQGFQDPWLAIVVDPKRTVASGKIDIGAFRTYPKGYTPPPNTASVGQSVPVGKVEDYGVHASRYYPLDVSYFKSSLDAHLFKTLWNKYWVQTLSSSPMHASRDHDAETMRDIAEKLNTVGSSGSSTSSSSLSSSASSSFVQQQVMLGLLGAHLQHQHHHYHSSSVNNNRSNIDGAGGNIYNSSSSSSPAGGNGNNSNSNNHNGGNNNSGVGSSSAPGGSSSNGSQKQSGKKKGANIGAIADDASKIAISHLNATMHQAVKEHVFANI